MRTLGILAVTLLTTLSIARPAAAAKAAEKAKPDEAADKAAPAPEVPDEDEAEAEAEAEPEIPHIVGPKLVDLGHGIEIDLPAGAELIERAAAQELVRAGGGDGENVLGIATKAGKDWWLVIELDDMGHVNDDDADELDADELLQAYRDGSVEQNKLRKAKGIPELFVDGWSEPPRYDRAHRQLLWGLNAHDSENDKVINFFTNVLGRTSIISLNLVDSPETIATAKAEAADILAATRFKVGSRYEDFDEKTDKDSGMGLTGLLLGGAGIAAVKGAKAGFFVKLLLIFKKFFWVVGIAIVALLKKLAGRKSEPTAEAVASTPPNDGPPTT